MPLHHAVAVPIILNWLKHSWATLTTSPILIGVIVNIWFAELLGDGSSVGKIISLIGQIIRETTET